MTVTVTDHALRAFVSYAHRDRAIRKAIWGALLFVSDRESVKAHIANLEIVREQNLQLLYRDSAGSRA